MNHFPVLLLRNLHAPCASQARACVLCAKLLLCCCPRTWPARNPGAMQRQANTFLTLHSSHPTLHTSHLHFISTHRIWALLISFHVFPYVSCYTQRSFYTQQAFTQRSFYTQQAFTHSKRLHTEHLHTVLLHMAIVYTLDKKGSLKRSVRNWVL